MTAADMIAELQDHGFNDASDARMMATLNDAYWDACAREPWPFLVKSIGLTFTGSSATASNFPADFRAATSMGVTAGQGSTVTGKVVHIREDDWLAAYGSNPQSGVPTMFYFVGNTMTFYPTPTATTVVTMRYLQQPAAIVDATVEATIVIPPAFHRAVIVNGALFKLYAMEDDTDIAPTFESYFERAIANMREYCWRNQYITQDIIHPVDADDVGLDTTWGNWTT